MTKLLIATTNAGKVREINCLLEGLQFEVIGLRDLPAAPPPVDETGVTFAENAILKAEYYFAQTGILSLADDSGLEVDALDGAPGIYSARFAGEHATDADRVVKLLAKLHDVPDEKRGAQFVCSIAITGKIDGATKTAEFTATARGRITHTTRGEGGFGYDPVFEDVALGRTFAELTRAEKSARSHRGKALACAKSWLENCKL